MADGLDEHALVQDHLAHLRGSAAFARSASLFTLLSYLVEETLDGRGGTLKELVIGDALYGRVTPYDPRIDSTVRVEARRLRRKLSDHYQGHGRHDPIRITLPVGGYRPSIDLHPVDEPVAPPAAPVTGSASPAVDLAIMPFRALSVEREDDCFVDGLTDEIIFALERRSRLKLAPRLAIFQFKNRSYSLHEAARSLGAGAMLHGTCRSTGSRTRVTVELSDPQGFVMWSAQIDQGRTDPFLLQERIADAIVERLPPWVIDATTSDRSPDALAS